MSETQQTPNGRRVTARAEPGELELDLDWGDTEREPDRWLSKGTPSKPLLNTLPLARLIPQDVHSVMDYLDSAVVGVGALMSNCPKARAASCVIGSSGIAASALTDYRVSLAKVIPIEAHEVIDYGFGVSAIAAPFLFGYYKTAPVVAAMHVATGIGTILASLFTDYRAYRGMGRSR